MKILVIGLDCAAPELLLADEQLENLRRLMEVGCFGRLESVIPPITVPAWMCLATSRDPGSLGVYGFRNRIDHSYAGLGIVNSKSFTDLTLWDQIAREGGRTNVIAVPPSYPPRKVSGVSVGCFLTPDPLKDTFTHPARLSAELNQLVDGYAVDVKGFRTSNKDWLRDEIFTMSRKQFAAVRHLMQITDWDYFQLVDIGLDRIQHGFWKYHDPKHVLHEPNSPYQNVIRDYYRHLDEEVGQLLELLDDETMVLVVSDHGAQRLDGGFCINEWFVREGLLVLHEYPREATPFSKLSVDWSRTRVWSEGGYYARIFFNVAGREPQGVLAREDYARFRNDLQAQLEATTGPDGQPLGTRVFKPEEVYREVKNVAPDLIVHFGDLSWRSIGGVGYPELHIRENDTGPDDCNHAQFGAFILAASGVPPIGELQGVHLLDMAPTLLELAGYDRAPGMQGQSLASALRGPDDSSDAFDPQGEAIVRERLRGLGYIS